MKSKYLRISEFTNQRIKSFSSQLLQCLFLILSTFFFFTYAAADQTLGVSKVTTVPVVDGSDSDDVWHQTKGITTHDKVGGIDVTIKAVYTDSQIFFLVQFPDPDESRLHKPWVWNSEKEMYDMGPHREDCFVFKWAIDDQTSDLSIYADEPYTADIWFWKANRTDFMGYADDKWQKLLTQQEPKTMPIKSKSSTTMFLQRKGDAGQAAYKSILHIEKMGEMLGQFTFQKPSGSRADVQARGFWKDGNWSIEFVRALKTGHVDDVQFNLSRIYLFGISRYEIAGRNPDPKLIQPLYGSGDVSERLKLVFEQEKK